jgi:hypothetical protein
MPFEGTSKTQKGLPPPSSLGEHPALQNMQFIHIFLETVPEFGSNPDTNPQQFFFTFAFQKCYVIMNKRTWTKEMCLFTCELESPSHLWTSLECQSTCPACNA